MLTSLAAVIIIVTLVGVAVGRYPWLHMNRATIALVGATITGNPQNMLIGISSDIPFVTFTSFLAPVAIVGLGLAWLVLVIVYRSEFSPQRLALPPAREPAQLYRPVLYQSLLATGLMVLAFILGAPVPLAALSAAALLLITRRVRPEHIFQEVDFSLLVFFSGLFILTKAIETAGFSGQLFALARPVAEQGIAALTGVAVVLSNLVSNVPAVMLFRPFVPSFPDPQQAWLTLAMATTLAGNLTLLGSVANLIVAETAKKHNVHLSFVEYLKSGAPITLLTLGVGIVWLNLVT